MRSFYLSLILMLLPASVVAETIHYEGSSTIGKFIADADKIYPFSSMSISVDSESLGGEQCALKDNCELGGVARRVDQAVLDQGVRATRIGQDSISVLVNVRNPVRSLSKQQLKGIFTGKINNWSELGGEDLAIQPYIVKSASATRHVFQQSVMNGEAYAGTRVVSPDRKILAKVIHQRGAIGQLSLAFLKGIKRIGVVSVDGQRAASNNPDYPISRPLYLLTHREPAAKVKAFLDWTLSDEGQSVVRKRFVGLK